MRQEPNRPPEQAAQRLADDSAELVRAEMARLRADVGEIVRRSAGGLVLTAVAGVGGLLALHAAAVVVLRSADRVLPPRAAAAVLAATYLGGAATAAVLGGWRLRAAGLTARRAAEDLRADAQAAASGGS